MDNASPHKLAEKLDDNLDLPLDTEQPMQGEARLRGLLAESADRADAEPGRRIEILCRLAHVQIVQEKVADAKATLKEAEEMLTRAVGAASGAPRIRYLIEMGRLLILDKTPSQARPLIVQAWTLASETGEDAHAISAAQVLAATEPQKAKKEWTQKALAIAEGSQQPRAQEMTGALYTAMGWIQYDLRAFEEALTYFRKASTAPSNQVHPKKLVIAKWSIARTYRALNRVEDALKIQEELLAELGLTNQTDGYVYEELAECLQFLRRETEAQVYFDLAYRELVKREWLADNRPERLKRLKTLGKVKP